jgi:ketosteroid isomerase-like protein
MKNQGNLAAAIIAKEKEMLEIWSKGNSIGCLYRITDDITYFDPDLTKRLDGFEQLKKLYENINGTFHIDSNEIIDPIVQTDGEIAVLSYNLISHTGGDVTQWNVTQVYRLQTDKQWKIIHSHFSYIRPMDIK